LISNHGIHKIFNTPIYLGLGESSFLQLQ